MIHVTTIVNNIYPSDLFLWQCQMREEGYSPEEIGRMAAEMGTKLHKTAEDVLAGKEETDGMLCYIKLKEWLGQYKITKILATEQKVFYYSEEGGYEGKLDTAMYLVLEDEEGSNWIIDIKSYGLYNYRNKTDFIPLTAQQKAKTNLQTWLYSQATHDKIGRHLDYKAFRRGCLHINELGYELYEFKRKPIKKIIERAQTLFTKTF